MDEIIASHARREGPLLPILNDIQAEFGCIDNDAKRRVAEALNLSRAEVHGVVSFYHDHKAEASTLPTLKLCRAEACQARGCNALAEEVSKSAKGKCKIEAVYCLGFCSVGPCAMIGADVHARLDSEKLQQLIEAM